MTAIIPPHTYVDYCRLHGQGALRLARLVGKVGLVEGIKNVCYRLLENDLTTTS